MAFNMDPKKCPMPTQDPNVRNKNFEEVALGYTAEMAVNEAKRCIHCKNKPCQSCCPVGIDIRSEEHTSELQSRFDLVCRLLLEKKKKQNSKRCGE